MRVVTAVLGAALMCAPVFAQEGLPPADGKAAVSGKVAEVVAGEGAGGIDTRLEMRALMTAVLDDLKITDDEKDLLREMLGPNGVTVTANGKTVALAAPPQDVAWMPQSLLTPPNLHQLWHRGGPAAEQFVEMARWGPALHQRIYRYIGNQLDDAWKKSTFLSAYGEYVGALNTQYKAFETLPADVETRSFAFDLLTTGVAYGVEKAKAENREPPKDFLYTWLIPEDAKSRFVNKQPLQLPEELQVPQQFQ